MPCPEHTGKRSVRAENWHSLYGARWQRYRLTFLAEHPLCECGDCRKYNRLWVATVVDHVIPHRGNLGLFWDPENHQAMAKTCHDRKTAREDGGFGNG